MPQWICFNGGKYGKMMENGQNESLKFWDLNGIWLNILDTHVFDRSVDVAFERAGTFRWYNHSQFEAEKDGAGN